jgi:hypothetical protein
MKKLNLTFLALALACTAADCTPLIVGRTSQGYLIGTNTKTSDGLGVCKVVYSHRRVLMLGGGPVALAKVEGSTGVPVVLVVEPASASVFVVESNRIT